MGVRSRRVRVALGSVLLVAGLVGCREAVTEPPAPPVPKTPVQQLRAALDSIRRKYGVPALGAALVRLDSGPLIATVGVRRWGGADSVKDSDIWHLGSNTKAFAGTELAILVNRGLLRWDISLEALYPELASSMNPQFRTATLADVLGHRAGLIRDVYGPATADAVAERARAMPGALAAAPVAPFGSFVYSNVGYMLAGSVVDRVLGRSWESAIQQDLLDPLGLRSATLNIRPIDGAGQPVGHQLSGGLPQPVLPESYEVPAAMNSAGRMHISLADWSRFVLMHLRGERGIDDVLPAARIVELHRPWHGIIGDAVGYNAGWHIADDAWAGRILEHGGSNGLNVSNAWLAPERGFAVLVVTNMASPSAQQAVNDMNGWVIAWERENLMARATSMRTGTSDVRRTQGALVDRRDRERERERGGVTGGAMFLAGGR